MLPLGPVAAAVEDVQLGVRHAPQQAQAAIHGHEAVVAAPDHQRRRGDFAQARAHVAKLLGVGGQAGNEVLEVILARHHVVEARFDQVVGQRAGIENEDVEHLLEVFEGRIAVQGLQQLDAFGGHRHKLAGAAGAAAHQDQLADAGRVGQRKGHGAVAAHRVADDMHAIEVQPVEHGLEGARIKLGAGRGADNRIALVPAQAVEQDHAVAGVDEGVHVAVEVGPAAGAGAGAVQHHDGFGTGAGVVVMHLHVTFIHRDAHETAGAGFGHGAGRGGLLACHPGVSFACCGQPGAARRGQVQLVIVF